MKKNLLLLCIYSISISYSYAVTRTWTGLGAPGNWTDGANWSGGVAPTPGAGDDIIFDGATTPTVLINNVPAFTNTQSFGFFRAINNVSVTLSGGSNTYLLFSTNLLIESGSRVNIGAGTTARFVFGGNTTTAGTTTIAGTLDLQGTGVSQQKSYSVYEGGSTTNAVASITGTIILSGSFSTISTSNSANLSFEAGAALNYTRDGGIAPAANFKNGSIINVTGTVSSAVNFGSGSFYNGLIIWNSPAQTAIAGSSNIFGSSVTIDSIRIISTGGGSLRGNTEIQNVTIGTFEMQGGTFQVASPRSANRTLTINNELKISGGTFILAGTDATDNSTKNNVAINLDGSVSVSGGTLNLSDRTNGTLSTYSVGQVFCKSNFIQTGGLITETGAIPPISDESGIFMNGTVLQNLALTNWLNEVRLTIANTTNGVNLLSNIICPKRMLMQGTASASSIVILNTFNLTVAHDLLFYLSGPGNVNKIVTNNTGSFILTGMSAGTTKVAAVTPDISSYNPVTITALAGAITNSYTVRVEPGNNPAGVYNTNRTIQRTWYITPATNILSNTVNLSFRYAAAEAAGGCIPNGAMELGHHTGTAWILDPNGNIVPTGADPYFVDPYAPATLGGSFVLGNVGSILTFENNITLRALKQNNKASITWAAAIADNIKAFVIERSINNRNFEILATINNNATNYIDDNLLQGLNYYRIKALHNNGKITYSPVAAILNTVAGFDIISLMPNIVSSTTLLNISAAQKTRLNIAVTDATGHVVQRLVQNIVAGSSILSIDATTLAAGIYQIHATTLQGDSRTVRFIKQ
jgi:hypothetical protein